MNEGSIAGLLGTLLIAGLAVSGLAGFASGSLLGPSGAGEYVVPTVAVLALTVFVVAALIVVGARSRRWRQNPYW